MRVALEVNEAGISSAYLNIYSDMSRKGGAASSSGSSSGGGNNKIELQTYLVQKLQEHEGGLSDEELQTIFGDRYGQELVEILNNLLNLNRLQLLKKGGVLIYKLIREETAVKFEGLAPEQMLCSMTTDG